ncbi:dynamin family protein [Halanaerobacter jeridensis]|uniref:Small GTP-binding protein n=1 Tax=Halanaerobacter jeridensis TaxID=706427 RepID=A0A938XV54_9FIRM|nr:dynamin family protein [Halanaerobacter jeridensis]MBM7558100.1 small GTP-binding protein [Halanaerobacter jeridensis]
MKLKKYISELRRQFSQSPLRDLMQEEQELPGGINSLEKNLTQIVDEINLLAEKLEQPLKLVMMGEVKSGKSTLLNALAGGEISPVDVTEATAAIIEVAYSESKTGELIRKDEENITGTPKEIFNILDEHQGEVDFFANCKAVQLGLPLENLKNLEIVDTPGLATVTAQNQATTKNYIQEADVVLWVFNAHHLGQADVSDDLVEVAKLGKPVIGVVNRMDQIDASDAEVITYMRRQYDIYLEEIFTFSAYQAFKGVRKDNPELLQESGYNELLNYLEENIEREADEVQHESIVSSLKSLVKQDVSLHDSYVNRLDFFQAEIKEHNKEINYHNQRIKEQFKQKLKNWGQHEFLRGEETRLLHKADNIGLFSRDNKKEIKEELERIFSEENIEQSLHEILREVNQEFKEEWKFSIEETKEKVKDDFKKFFQQEKKRFNQQLDEGMDSGNELAVEGAGQGAAVGGALGTTIAAYSALIGPYASSVTLTAAIGSFLPPYLIGGVVAGAVAKLVNFNSKKNEYKAMISKKFREIKTEHINAKIIPEIISNLEEHSDRIAQNIKDNFAKQLCNQWTETEIKDLQIQLKDYLGSTKIYANQNIEKQKNNFVANSQEVNPEQISKIQSKLKQKQAEVQEYREKLTANDEEIMDIIEENEEYKHKTENLKEELTNKVAKADELESRLEDLKSKRINSIEDHFSTCYPNISFHKKVYDQLVSFSEQRMNFFEKEIAKLQYQDYDKINPKRKIGEAFELTFAGDGRIYYSYQGNQINIYRVGDKNSQTRDIEWIKNNLN